MREINIEIHYIVNDNRIYRSGSFKVKEDFVHTARVWVYQIQKEHGYDLVLEKVIVNGSNDITDEIKKIL